MGDATPDPCRILSRCGGFRLGITGAHHGRYRIARRRRRRVAGKACQPAGAAAPGLHPHDHRPARHRLRGGRAAETAGLDAGTGTSRDRGIPGAGCADDGHLHQLPDDHAGGARRAHGVRRHRCGDLREQRTWRTIQFRGGPFRFGRRPDRPNAALRLSSGGEAARHAAAAPCHHAAGAARLGRTRRRCRPDCRRLLAGAGDDRHRSCSHLG